MASYLSKDHITLRAFNIFPRHLRTFADHFICPTTSKVNRVKRLSLTKEEEVRHVFLLRSSCTSGAIIDFPPELWRQNFFRRLRQLGNGLAALPTATVTEGGRRRGRQSHLPRDTHSSEKNLNKSGLQHVVSNGFYPMAGFFCSFSSFANTCPLCNSHEKVLIVQTAVESSSSVQDQRARALAGDAIAKS